MAHQVFNLPRSTAISSNLTLIAGAKVGFFLTTTSTPTNSYQDSALTTPHTNPVVADSAGRLPAIYLDPSILYRITFVDSADVEIYPAIDPANDQILTQAIFNAHLALSDPYKRTAAEIAAGVTPVNYAKLPGEVLRQGNNTTPGTTNVVTHIQAAIDAASDIDAEVYLRDDNAIAAPILFRTTTQQSLSIIGNGRVSTNLRPSAANISVAPHSVNALFINLKDNLNLHLKSFRCIDAAAYVGKFLYAVEGGGSAALAQALYSAVIDDCWFAFSTNNSGIFQGGFQNLLVTGCVFEATKDACFILEGVGNGDQQYIGNQMNTCYDSFIRQENDGNPVNLLLVDGLHVYAHLRGRIIDLTEANNVNINNVLVEFDAANVGDCGLIRLLDCTDVRVTNCTMSTASGTPRGDVGIDIIGACTATFENVKITADIGLRVQGTGAIDLTFVDCDFIGCQHAFQQLSGTLSGKIRFLNCRLNNSDEYGMLHQAGTPSFDIEFIAGEVMNAGMGGITTSRNINISTSGTVRFVGTKIGQNDANADAASYIRADGAGTFKVLFPRITGTPPTSTLDASSTQTVEFVWEPSAAAKTFQLAAAATTVVNDTDVQTSSVIALMPTNAAAATLMSGAKSLYVSARTAGTSFTVATADATNAAGTENFAYRVLP